jgi:hypothetical protein
MDIDIRDLQMLPEDEPEIGMWPCPWTTGSDDDEE